MLFVCPMYADYGGSLYTVRINRVGDEIIWSDFKWNPKWDGEVTRNLKYQRMKFPFDAARYFHVMGAVDYDGTEGGEQISRPATGG